MFIRLAKKGQGSAGPWPHADRHQGEGDDQRQVRLPDQRNGHEHCRAQHQPGMNRAALAHDPAEVLGTNLVDRERPHHRRRRWATEVAAGVDQQQDE
jgi:hypothetical protein